MKRSKRIESIGPPRRRFDRLDPGLPFQTSSADRAGEGARSLGNGDEGTATRSRRSIRNDSIGPPRSDRFRSDEGKGRSLAEVDGRFG